MALYAFDGTSRDDELEDSRDTNVVRFARAYRGCRIYRSGVGTRFGALGRVFGGWMGVGLHQRVEEAIDALRINFARGDQTIDVIGFSRGAAAALHFVNEVWEKVGNKQPDAATIRFVGLFDTVASTGPLPGPVDLNLDLELPPNVGRCCHAMALDESRASFHLQRVKPRRPVPEGTIQETWFRGCHSDIGGGHQHGSLASIPLVWMLRHAAAAGVQLHAEEVQQAIAERNHRADILRATFDKKLGKRKVKAGDHVHCSVFERAGHVNPPTVGCFVVDDHGGIRGSYPGEMPWPFDIDWQGTVQPRPRLARGEETIVDVFAAMEWNEVPHVYLEREAVYEFAVAKTIEDFVDGDIPVPQGPVGHDAGPLRAFKRFARVPDHNWFHLIGAVDRTGLFSIGKGCKHQAPVSGEFGCFVNDAPFKYGNNRGHIQLAVKRIA